MKRRTSASGSILYLCLGYDFVTEVSAKVLRCAQVDLASDDAGQLDFYARHTDQSNRMPWLELNQNVDIAVLAEVVTKHGSEKRKLPDIVALALPKISPHSAAKAIGPVAPVGPVPPPAGPVGPEGPVAPVFTALPPIPVGPVGPLPAPAPVIDHTPPAFV